MIKHTNEQAKKTEQFNDQTQQRANHQTHERANDKTHERANDQTNEQANDQIHEQPTIKHRRRNNQIINHTNKQTMKHMGELTNSMFDCRTLVILFCSCCYCIVIDNVTYRPTQISEHKF